MFGRSEDIFEEERPKEEKVTRQERREEKLREKERDIRLELLKDESYTDQIETYRKKVEELDKKLGVDKK